MKRIFAFFALLCCGFAVLNAQVTSDPAILYRDYTGTITLTYDPAEGDGGMVAAVECYSHIGLITTESENPNDWKHIKNDDFGTKNEPKWTRVGTKWQLTIDNFYTYFECPTTELVNQIVMTFHNGKKGEEDFMQGKTETHDAISVKVNPVPTCYYTLEMWDRYADGWDGDAALLISEGAFSGKYKLQPCTEKHAIVEVPAYGGNPELHWIEGGMYDKEISFSLYASNGTVIFRHNEDEAFGANPILTMAQSPCVSSPNLYEVTNIEVTVTSNVATITWDDNTSVNNWQVQIIAPSGELVESIVASTPSTNTSNLGTIGQSGAFTARITPRDASNNPLSVPFDKTFDITLAGIGDVNLRVLIPSDSDFDISKGVKAQWRGYDGILHDVALAQEGSTRWWGATLSITQPAFTVAVNGGDDDSKCVAAWNSYQDTNDDLCFEIGGVKSATPTQKNYRLSKVDCSTAEDHNGLPTATEVTTALGKATFNVTTVNGTAPNYEVTLYVGDHEYAGSFGTSTWPYTYTPLNDADLIITSWDMYIYDDGYNQIGKKYEYEEGFTIPARDRFPIGMTAVANDDKTCTATWTPTDGAGYYRIWITDAANNSLYNATMTKADLDASYLDGDQYKITTTSTFTANGEATFTIRVYDSSDDYISDNEIKFNVDKALGDKTIRVFVPDDNNMDLSLGLWIWYTSDSKPDGKCYSTAYSSNWYEATITDDPDATIYSFLVVNKEITTEADWTGAQQSVWVENVTKKNICKLLDYNPEPTLWPQSWTFANTESCSLSNHNYKITAVTLDETTGGCISVTGVATSDKAASYKLYARVNGSSEPYQFVGMWYGYMSYPVNYYIQNAATVIYDYQVVPCDGSDEHLQLADAFGGTVTILASPYVMSNVKVNVAADNVTANFSWDENSSVDHYMIEIYKKATGDWVAGLGDITANTASHKILFSGEYTWKLFLYDSYDNLLSSVNGSAFTITAPDFTPTNVKLTMPDAMTAILSFDLNPLADYIEQQLYIPGVYTAWNTNVTGKDGHYTLMYSFSNEEKGSYKWRIMPMDEDGNYLLDAFVMAAEFDVPKATPQYTVTISAGAGGSVNTAVNGLHDEGETVHLVATPNSGFSFVEWSDHNTDAERDIVVTADVTLEASFIDATTEYTLTLNCNAGGTVSADPVGPTYTVGTPVTITATPDAEHKFVQWNDGNTSASRTINIISDTTFTATFVEKGASYTLTLGTSEHGTVAASPVGPSYEAGTSVTLTATPASGYHFAKWQDGNTDNPRTIVMDADKSFTATFLSDTKYTIKVTAGENGKVKINDGTEKTSVTQEFYGGEVITITAVPEEGYTLDEWSDDDEEKSLSREITVSANLTTKATFRELKKFTLSVIVTPGNAGTVKLNGETREGNTMKVTEGKSVTVTATAAEGFKFKGYKYNDEFIGTASEISILMNKSKEVYAVFEEAQGFENVKAEEGQIQKLLINGQLFILRDGKLYNAAGVLVK